ncbi:MAG: OB-fold nucleic acid binding domain-containing protein, partial [Planctomycetota bacterium]|nr:OB-fold nucleic acid binding domain-containing protein [Planctomycetota bacterium]
MSRKFLKQFHDGESVNEIFLLADKQLRANRNADLYLLATLRDNTGQINGMMWNVTEEAVSHVTSGDLVRVKGKIQLYQGGLQMILNYIAPVAADDYDPADFHLGTSKNVDLLLNKLNELLDSISDDHLRAVMNAFVADNELMAAFRMAPAGIKVHHAYHGGLLEHVVNMMEVCD